MTGLPTNRWRGIVAVALLAGTVGLLATRPFVLLVAVVAAGYAAYPRLSTPPAVELTIERTVNDSTPRHGTPVEVTVEVTNVGERTLPDVRIIDGVPPMLTVTEGTARHAAALRPGGSATFTYTVDARHGVHSFEPATAIVRDLSGAYEVEAELPAEGAIDCRRAAPTVPIQTVRGRRVAGSVVASDGGSGIEFHQTREYRHGDPMNRIDWKRFARTGELTTIEFAVERSTSIVLCLDARPTAYRAAGDDEPHGVVYGIAAADRLLAALEDAGAAVGLAAIGRELCWLAPDVGEAHALDAAGLLSAHPTLSIYPPDEAGLAAGTADRQLRELRTRLRPGDQPVVISPLTDGFIVEAATDLEAAGHTVTVISPDLTSTATIGGRLAAIERRHRLRSLREASIRVIEWDPDTSLGTAFERAGERWPP